MFDLFSTSYKHICNYMYISTPFLRWNNVTFLTLLQLSYANIFQRWFKVAAWRRNSVVSTLKCPLRYCTSIKLSDFHEVNLCWKHTVTMMFYSYNKISTLFFIKTIKCFFGNSCGIGRKRHKYITRTDRYLYCPHD